MADLRGKARPLIVGRYELHGEIARGGMATVHLGRILSDAGFSRTVAIKRLHPQCAADPAFAAMFVDEARLASRIHHPNVVSTLDVVVSGDELFVVMEYVQGESLSRLQRLQFTRGFMPVEFVTAIGAGVLDGLHAAHEAVSESDEPLGIVHRDVSPQNILVGVDGVPRIIDFGVAKAARRLQTTREGQLKGKLRYMPPEQFAGAPPDRRSDIYASAIVVWEALTGKRLFDGETDAESVGKILRGASEPPSFYAPHVPRALDDVVMCGLAIDPGRRFPTAQQMALALEAAAPLASTRRIGEWVRSMAADSLSDRAKHILEIESNGSGVNVNVRSVLPATPQRGNRGHELAGPPSLTASQMFVQRRGSVPDREEEAVWVEAETETTFPGRGDAAIDADAKTEFLDDPRPPSPGFPPQTFEPPTESSPFVPSGAFANPGFAPRPAPVPPPPASSRAPRRSFPALAPPSHGDRATPVNPFPAAVPAPPSARVPPLSVDIPAPPPRGPAPPPPGAPPPMGLAWHEVWDGAACTCEFRPITVTIAAMFGAFILLVAIFIFTQLALFGIGGVIGLVLGLAISGFILLRMLRSTHLRVDATGLTMEIRPSGPTTFVASERIRMFLVVDDPTRRDPSLFCVHVLLIGGDFHRLDVEFPSDADARFVAVRLNDILAEVRGGPPAARLAQAVPPRT